MLEFDEFSIDDELMGQTTLLQTSVIIVDVQHKGDRKKLLNISNENKIGRKINKERKICFANLI
jgi:hypothetical protein